MNNPVAPIAAVPDLDRAVKRAIRRIRKEIGVTAARIRTLRDAARVVRPVTARLKMDPAVWATMTATAQSEWQQRAAAVRLQRKLDVAAARPVSTALHSAADKLIREADRLGRHARLLHHALAYYRGGLDGLSRIERRSCTPIDRRGLVRMIARFDSTAGIVTTYRPIAVWL